MATNRLYIGIKSDEKQDRKAFCISKPGDGDTWRGISNREIKGINEILKSEYALKDKTDLVFFSESDTELFNYFFGEENLVLNIWCPDCIGIADTDGCYGGQITKAAESPNRDYLMEVMRKYRNMRNGAPFRWEIISKDIECK